MKSPIRHDRQPEHTIAKLDLVSDAPHSGRVNHSTHAADLTEHIYKAIAAPGLARSRPRPGPLPQ